MATTLDPSKELLYREITSRIRAALELKDWNKIEFWARKWIQMDPSRADGFKWLARSCLAQNNLKMAGYAYSRLLDFDSQNAEAVKFFEDYPSYTVQELSKQEAYNTAMAEVSPEPRVSLEQKVSALSPDLRRRLSVKFFELAGLFEEAKNLGKASEFYLASYEMQASQIAGLAAARCLHANHQSAEALKFLRIQVENFPSWVEGRMLLGRVNFEVGQRAEAQRHFQMVLKLEPNHKQALQALRQLVIS